MSKSKRRARTVRIPLVESFWIHYADYCTGRQMVLGEEGYEMMDRVEREEHWGRRHACAKCRQDGTFGEFTNFPTGRGFLVYGAVTVTVIVALIGRGRHFGL